MDGLALYRKYRPTIFKEVVGQSQVISVLEGALKVGQVAHAYLFAGPRGTGKTSVARILARELGTSANDLYEIDAASNRGIDEIRELREAVRTLPFDSKYKVYIIDEVHMLTREAFNALLKTLEEPPAHVIFILATTEIHKLPETIVSRCQSLQFHKPSVDVLQPVIERIAKAEKWPIEPEASELIALLGDGSFRDAIGVLQQVISFAESRRATASGGRKISRQLVGEISASPRQALIEDFLKALLLKDLPVGLNLLRQVTRENYDFKVWVRLVLRQLRLALLLKFAPGLGKEMTTNLSADEAKFLTELVRLPGASQLPQLLREFLTIYDELGRTELPEVSLEVSLVNLLTEEKE